MIHTNPGRGSTLKVLPAAARQASGSYRFPSLLTFAGKLTVHFAANENQAISHAPFNPARWLLVFRPSVMLEIKKKNKLTKSSLTSSRLPFEAILSKMCPKSGPQTVTGHIPPQDRFTFTSEVSLSCGASGLPRGRGRRKAASTPLPSASAGKAGLQKWPPWGGGATPYRWQN